MGRPASTEKMLFWKEHIDAYQQSDLFQPQYCRKHNLRLDTFKYWLKRNRDPNFKFPDREISTDFIPIKVKETVSKIVPEQDLKLQFPNQMVLSFPFPNSTDKLIELIKMIGGL